MQEFIDDEKITWPILFPQEKKDQFWNNPLAVYYGVNGIPCVILIDQKGKVVSLNARGPELGKKLEELLGKVGRKRGQGRREENRRERPRSSSAGDHEDAKTRGIVCSAASCLRDFVALHFLFAAFRYAAVALGVRAKGEKTSPAGR